MDFKLCELLGIKYPILQGGMAWIADASLASAVSNAGGLGIIATGDAPPSFVRNEIHKAKQMTKNVFGINIMLLSPYVNEIVDLVIEENIKVVTTGAGDPAKHIAKFKTTGIKVIPVVASVALAKRMKKFGADAVIAEGMEAGGHIGKLTTMSLIPQIVDVIDVPVISAGGIADGRGMAASFMLGAEGIQIGTRFLVSNECNIHDNYKTAVLKAKDIDTIITGEITGHPVRVIRNKASKEFQKLEKEEYRKENPNIKMIEQLGSGGLRKAVEGDIINGSIMAGQISGLIRKEKSCQEIINEIINDFESTISKFVDLGVI